VPRVFIKSCPEEIKFECQRCGSCCHHRRPEEFDDLIPMERMEEFVCKSNLIYLTEKDVHDIGFRAKLPPEEFVDTLYQYDGCFVKVEDSGKKVILDLPVMKSKTDTTCVLYKDGCTVYPVRPKACRLFPFRVEEETSPEGDITLNISYNPNCPGIGKGSIVNKTRLEKLVLEQFTQRTQSIAPRVQKLVAAGKIERGAKVYRTLPGRKPRGR
jgi:uncharacterized protein